MLKKSRKKICLWVSLMTWCAVAISAASHLPVSISGDSVARKVPFSEYTHIYKNRRVSSTYPVEVKVRRNALLVTSKHSQMLPVYKSNGVFYGLFRLNKGTNWISGLPKGTYIINNSKVVVS